MTLGLYLGLGLGLVKNVLEFTILNLLIVCLGERKTLRTLIDVSFLCCLLPLLWCPLLELLRLALGAQLRGGGVDEVVHQVEQERGQEEQPTSPQHPARVGCRDEAGLSSVFSSLGSIQGRVGDAFASLLIIHNVCHGHSRPDCQP